MKLWDASKRVSDQIKVSRVSNLALYYNHSILSKGRHLLALSMVIFFVLVSDFVALVYEIWKKYFSVLSIARILFNGSEVDENVC